MVKFEKLKVLLLDDEAIVTNILTAMLDDIGVGGLRAFNCPNQANQALLHYKPNVIISDIEMGVMNGFEFIKNIRQEHAHSKQAAVMFLTGHSDPNFIAQAKALRVAGYLLKPVEPKKLKSSLERVYGALLVSGRL